MKRYVNLMYWSFIENYFESTMHEILVRNPSVIKFENIDIFYSLRFINISNPSYFINFCISSFNCTIISHFWTICYIVFLVLDFAYYSKWTNTCIFSGLNVWTHFRPNTIINPFEICIVLTTIKKLKHASVRLDI